MQQVIIIAEDEEGEDAGFPTSKKKASEIIQLIKDRYNIKYKIQYHGQIQASKVSAKECMPSSEHPE